MTTRDGSHLAALELRLSHERVRLANSKTQGERELRAVWVAGIEKEIKAELALLGKDGGGDDSEPLSHDELLAALQGD